MSPTLPPDLKIPFDFCRSLLYNPLNFIRQFVTILSLNKTRTSDGHTMPIFCFVWVRTAPIFYFGEIFMKKHTRKLVHAAILAALYAVLTHFQNILLPGSATWAIQMRMSEALSVLAFFTPTVALGLAVGCLVFNLTFAAALPLDFLVGTLATYLACKAMWLSRNVQVKNYPLVGMLMPALFNAVLVGWELSVYIGGGFWMNALYVAIGEIAVLLTAGSVLYYAMKKRNLDTRLFA